MNFGEIATKRMNLYSTRFGGSTAKCPDEWVGTLKVANGKVSWNEKWIVDREKKRCTERRTIDFARILVVVLESPHVDEFSAQDKPLGPGRGTTGRNLQKYFACHLVEVQKMRGKPIANGEYQVVLANAIQYQASLGLDTDVLRDRIWLLSWFGSGEDDFLQRLIAYNPVVVVNLCTQGSHRRDPWFTGPNVSMSNIRFDFLTSIDSVVVRDADGTLTRNGKPVFAVRHTKLSKKTGQALSTKCYPLSGFVQTALDKFCDCAEQRGLPVPPMLVGVHPSSGRFVSSKGCEVIQLATLV